MKAIFEEDGSPGITHQNVAKRAGVGRATVYRHWPRAVDLVREAIAQAEHPIFREGTGPLRPWLRQELLRIAAGITRLETKQFIATLISTADRDPHITAIRDDLVHRTEKTLNSAFDRALAAGELSYRPNALEFAAQLVPGFRSSW